MSIEQKLVTLKGKCESIEKLKKDNEVQLAILNNDAHKLVEEITKLGFDPDKLEEILKIEEAAVEAETTALDTELSRILTEINGI